MNIRLSFSSDVSFNTVHGSLRIPLQHAPRRLRTILTRFNGVVVSCGESDKSGGDEGFCLFKETRELSVLTSGRSVEERGVFIPMHLNIFRPNHDIYVSTKTQCNGNVRCKEPRYTCLRQEHPATMASPDTERCDRDHYLQ